MACNAVPASFPQGAKGGGCRLQGEPPRDFRWDSTWWRTFKPALVRDEEAGGGFLLELDAAMRYVMAAGNYINGPARFASVGDQPYVKLARADHPVLTAQVKTADICTAFSPRVCCWTATAYNEPGSCDETRQLYYNSGETTCISCKDSDYPSVTGDLFTALYVSLKDAPYFGSKDRLIPGSDPPRSEAVYAVEAITEFPGSAQLVPRVRFRYDPEQLALSCSAVSDWNDMLSSLSDASLGVHISYDTDVMKALCSRTWRSSTEGQEETCNWLECASCRKWADALKYEDGENGGACTVNPLGGDCPASYADLQMQHWCQDRAEHPSCKCVLRAQQKDWQQFAAVDRSNAGCWYKPCAGGMTSGGYLVEHDVRHAQDTNNCPDICQSVINILDSGEVTLDDVTQSTVCKGGGAPTSVKKAVIIAACALAAVAVAAAGIFVYVRRAKKFYYK